MNIMFTLLVIIVLSFIAFLLFKKKTTQSPLSFSYRLKKNGFDNSSKSLFLINQGDCYIAKRLLTPREEKFFLSVQSYLPPEYHLLTQVRLVDLITPSTRFPAKSNEYQALFRQISQWHIDFVIINKKTFNTVALIECDDQSHQRADRKRRDLILNEILQQTKLNFLRVNKLDELPKKLKFICDSVVK